MAILLIKVAHEPPSMATPNPPFKDCKASSAVPIHIPQKRPETLSLGNSKWGYEYVGTGL